MPQNTIAEKVIAYLRQEEPDYAEAAKLGEAALPILRDIIKGSDVALASKATSLAGFISGSQQKDALIDAAKHPSDVVRVAAAAASKELSKNDAQQVLGQLINDADVGVSKYTLQSIKAKKLTGAFSDKIKNISDKHPQESIKAMAKNMLQTD